MLMVESIKARDAKNCYVLVNGTVAYVNDVDHEHEEATHDNVVVFFQINRYKEISKKMHSSSHLARIEVPTGLYQEFNIPDVLMALKKDF